MKILVTGATGTQGGATARRLLADGHAVRILVRDPGAPAARALAAGGAELAVGDLDEPAGLGPALRGVAGLFTAPPATLGPLGPDDELEAARGRALAEAAVAAGVGHVVFSGVAAAGPRTTSGKEQIEELLRTLPVQVTVLRPVRFMSNFFGVGLPFEGITGGVHRHLFPPDEPVQSIDPEDIAEFAAFAFADPARYAGRTLELAGDAISPRAAVAAISEATGVPVRYEQLTAEEAAAVGPAIATARAGWIAGHRWRADIEALRVIHPGLRTVRDWLDQGAAARLRAHLAAA